MNRLAGIFFIVALLCLWGAHAVCLAEDKVSQQTILENPLPSSFDQQQPLSDTNAALTDTIFDLDSTAYRLTPLSMPSFHHPWQRSRNDGKVNITQADPNRQDLIDPSFNWTMFYRTPYWLTSIRAISRYLDGPIQVFEVVPKTETPITIWNGIPGSLCLSGNLIFHAASLDRNDGLLSYFDSNLTRGFNASARATYRTGSAYLGSAFTFLQQQTPFNLVNNGIFSGGENAMPILIFLNADRGRALGQTAILFGGLDPLYATAYGVDISRNMFLHQSFAGWRATPGFDFNVTFSLARLDLGLCNPLTDEIGRELDFTASYRILDNLNFMAAFGFLWTGDALKHATPGYNLQTDWLLMHRLTLSF